jgi:hypothetical protein
MFTGDALAELVKRMFATVKSAISIANHKRDGSYCHSVQFYLFLKCKIAKLTMSKT